MTRYFDLSSVVITNECEVIQINTYFINIKPGLLHLRFAMTEVAFFNSAHIFSINELRNLYSNDDLLKLSVIHIKFPGQ